MRTTLAVAILAIALTFAAGTGATPEISDSCASLAPKGTKPPRSPLNPGFATAKVVFIGVATAGPAAPGGELFDPATFRVIVYLKGHGGPTLRVATGRTPTNLNSGVFGGYYPRAGEQWLIFAAASDKRGALLTGGECGPAPIRLSPTP